MVRRSASSSGEAGGESADRRRRWCKVFDVMILLPSLSAVEAADDGAEDEGGGRRDLTDQAGFERIPAMSLALEAVEELRLVLELEYDAPW